METKGSNGKKMRRRLLGVAMLVAARNPSSQGLGIPESDGDSQKKNPKEDLVGEEIFRGMIHFGFAPEVRDAMPGEVNNEKNKKRQSNDFEGKSKTREEEGHGEY